MFKFVDAVCVPASNSKPGAHHIRNPLKPECHQLSEPWVTGVSGVYQGPLQIINGIIANINLWHRVSSESVNVSYYAWEKISGIQPKRSAPKSSGWDMDNNLLLLKAQSCSLVRSLSCLRNFSWHEARYTSGISLL